MSRDAAGRGRTRWGTSDAPHSGPGWENGSHGGGDPRNDWPQQQQQQQQLHAYSGPPTSNQGPQAGNAVFVGGLPLFYDDERFAEQFRRFGDVVHATVQRDTQGVSRGFGIVEFTDGASAARTLSTEVYIPDAQGERKVSIRPYTPKKSSAADVPPPPGTTPKLFIGGLADRTTTQGVREHFSRFGQVDDCIVMLHPDGRSKCFGFVTFASIQQAEDCISAPSHIVDGVGVALRRAIARSRPGGRSFADRPRGGDFDGGGRGEGGRRDRDSRDGSREPGTGGALRAPPPPLGDVDPYKVFVSSIKYDVDSESLGQYFSQFGKVTDSFVVPNPVTNRSKGFGFVTFESPEVVQRVLATAHVIAGRPVEIKPARAKVGDQRARYTGRGSVHDHRDSGRDHHGDRDRGRDRDRDRSRHGSSRDRDSGYGRDRDGDRGQRARSRERSGRSSERDHRDWDRRSGGHHQRRSRSRSRDRRHGSSGRDQPPGYHPQHPGRPAGQAGPSGYDHGGGGGVYAGGAPPHSHDLRDASLPGPPPVMRPPPQYDQGYGQGVPPHAAAYGQPPPEHSRAPYAPPGAGAPPGGLPGEYGRPGMNGRGGGREYRDARDPQDHGNPAAGSYSHHGGAPPTQYSVTSPRPAQHVSRLPPPAAVNTSSLLDLVSMVDADDEPESRHPGGRHGADPRRAAAHLPPPAAADQPPRDLPPGWVAHKSKSRNTWFYFNEKTGVSVWTKPTA